MTVTELIETLRKMPAEAQICLAFGIEEEVTDFAVELADDREWVVLEA